MNIICLSIAIFFFFVSFFTYYDDGVGNIFKYGFLLIDFLF